jgi:hypothetical protein
MKRNILIALFFLSFISNSYSQFSIKPTLLVPSGAMGSIIKTNIALEGMYMEEFDPPWRFRYGGFIGLLTGRKDTFPSYAIQEDNSGTLLLPGYFVIHPSFLLYGTIGTDFCIKEGNITPYIGGSFLMGGLILNYDEKYQGYVDGSYFMAGGVLLGGEFRIGAQKTINENFDLYLEASTDGYYVTETGVFSHYSVGLGIIF